MNALVPKIRQDGGRDVTLIPRSLPKSGEDEYCEFDFKHRGYIVGTISLCKTRWGFWETHAELSHSLHNKGYGVLMYDIVITYAKKQNWEVRSSLDYSNMAENVWKSKRLRSRHAIRRAGKRYVAA